MSASDLIPALMTPLVIVHYHLRPGGVTRVIESHSRSLTRRGHPHVILCGGPDRIDDDLPVRVDPSLDYQTGCGDPAALCRSLTDHARAAFPDVSLRSICWHVHNPMLGKNPALTVALTRLAADGHAMLLEHHDFAEDNRPAQWQQLADLPALYPVSPRILHATVNTRDHDYLVAAGIPRDHVTRFANPVDPPTSSVPSDRATADPLVFLPTRAISRKNIGEVVLIAALSPPKTRFAISRAPDNGHPDHAIHDHWQKLARELELPIEFAVSDRIPPRRGASTDRDAWFAAATHSLSCSMAEGFGYTFLEAPAHGLPVFGRCPLAIAQDLPHPISQNLYRQLAIPAHWLSAAEKPNTNRIDFGGLSQAAQTDVIQRALAEPDALRVVLTDGTHLALRGYLASRLANRTPADVDLKLFLPDTCAEVLVDHTDRLVNSPVRRLAWLPKDAMRRQFSESALSV